MAEETTYAARLTAIEGKLAQLETNQAREDAFRNEFYNYQKDQIARDARLDEQIKHMNHKLDTLVSWQKEQQSRPMQRWNGLMDKILWCIVGGVLTFLLARFGL